MDASLRQFASHYARHRAEEGRAYSAQALVELPYLKSGPHVGQWAVRARTFEAFMTQVLRPAAARSGRPLTVLDLGAGNAWLAARAAVEGHRSIALDIREDSIERTQGRRTVPAPGAQHAVHHCIVRCRSRCRRKASISPALSNASLHYATDLRAVLREVQRLVRPGGQLAILDSPFYRRELDGEAMVAEKRNRLGSRAEQLMALPFIEFLTEERLHRAAPELVWKRRKVIYPLTYRTAASPRPFDESVDRPVSIQRVTKLDTILLLDHACGAPGKLDASRCPSWRPAPRCLPTSAGRVIDGSICPISTLPRLSLR